MADKTLQIILKLKDEATAQLKGVSGAIKKNAESFKRAGAVMTIAGGAITAVSAKLIGIASDAEETQGKFNVVFRGMEKETNAWAISFAASVGRANQDIKAFSSGIADVLKPMGLQTAAAAAMSQEMVALALDVASFNNRQDEDVIRAFTSALTGERESLKTLGIVITEADVKQEALTAGLIKQGEELTKTAKATATMNLLFKNSKDAQGDLQRTSESFANQQKALQSQLKNVSETIGTQLLPIANQLIGTFAAILTKVAGWIEENPKLAATIAKIIAVVGAIMLVLGPLLIILPGIATAVGILGGAFALLNAPILIIIAAVAAVIAIGILLVKNWDKIKAAAGAIFNSIKATIVGVWDSITASITASINKIMAVINKVKNAFNKIKSVVGGGIRRAREAVGFSGGGIVKKFAGGGMAGRDSIPAMLTPGEVVLNAAQQKNLAGQLGGGGQIMITGNTFQGTSPEMANQVFELLMNKIKGNLIL